MPSIRPRLAGRRRPSSARAHGAWINLFNLLPIWQLDGGRRFHALFRGQRIAAAFVQYVLLVIAFSAMCLLEVPGGVTRASAGP